MNYELQIRRQKSPRDKSYVEKYQVEADPSDSIAAILLKLNETLADPVSWECSCMQKQCGACAMLINERPGLACATWAGDFKKPVIRLAPLSKFPLVKDLIVDRQFLFDQLKELSVWLDKEASHGIYTGEQHFAAAGCLMCGCCLEICPNFSVRDSHAGAIAAVNMFRTLDDETDQGHYDTMKRLYRDHFYETCGKSLSCHDICPAGLPVEELIVRSNAAAVKK